MSGINPNDYPGANVTIVGYAGGEVEERSFPKGGSVAQLSIGVGTGYKKDDEWVDTGTNWYTLTASPDYAQENWPVVEKGDKVRIDDARLEFKSYNTKDGDARTDATLRFGTLVVLESASDRGSSSRGSSSKNSATPF